MIGEVRTHAGQLRSVALACAIVALMVMACIRQRLMLSARVRAAWANHGVYIVEPRVASNLAVMISVAMGTGAHAHKYTTTSEDEHHTVSNVSIRIS